MFFSKMNAGDLIQTKHKLIGEVVAVDKDTVEVYFLFLIKQKRKESGFTKKIGILY